MSSDRPRILIVEDDSIARKILVSTLKAIGDCEFRESGYLGLSAAVSAIEQGLSYDLICLDYLMPDMNGIDILKTIRKIEDAKKLSQKERSSIMMVTGITESSNILSAFQEGCEAYITKPIEISKLKEALVKLELV